MSEKRTISLPVILLVFLLMTGTSCHVARYVWWNFANINDYKKFPVDSIPSSDKPHSFQVNSDMEDIDLPDSGYFEMKRLGPFLEQHKTVAFLIIRNDTLYYEKYFGKYSRESVFPSFSVAKSFVSALVGIAIGEGKVKSVDQPVTDYIPELKDPLFQQVTIRDLLEMRSGIRYEEGYSNPFGLMAKFYYGLNLKKYTLSLKMEGQPGIKYNYQSANTELLGIILERATGMSLSDYLAIKIWQPMGAEYPASWSIDSKSDRQIKAFCCINARTIDFAKFGQLFLDKGIIGSDTLIPSSWVSESLSIQTDSRDSEGFPYSYHWRVTEEGDFFAKGILGQYIYVCPEKKVVIVRIGKKSASISWARFFRNLSRSL
jgi:CubicO group peptidase (beta-lactamase class C family)